MIRRRMTWIAHPTRWTTSVKRGMIRRRMTWIAHPTRHTLKRGMIRRRITWIAHPTRHTLKRGMMRAGTTWIAHPTRHTLKRGTISWLAHPTRTKEMTYEDEKIAKLIKDGLVVLPSGLWGSNTTDHTAQLSYCRSCVK